MIPLGKNPVLPTYCSKVLWKEEATTRLKTDCSLALLPHQHNHMYSEWVVVPFHALRRRHRRVFRAGTFTGTGRLTQDLRSDCLWIILPRVVTAAHIKSSKHNNHNTTMRYGNNQYNQSPLQRMPIMNLTNYHWRVLGKSGDIHQILPLPVKLNEQYKMIVCHTNPTRVARVWGRTEAEREGTKLGLAKKCPFAHSISLPPFYAKTMMSGQRRKERRGRWKLDFCISARELGNCSKREIERPTQKARKSP